MEKKKITIELPKRDWDFIKSLVSSYNTSMQRGYSTEGNEATAEKLVSEYAAAYIKDLFGASLDGDLESLARVHAKLKAADGSRDARRLLTYLTDDCKPTMFPDPVYGEYQENGRKELKTEVKPSDWKEFVETLVAEGCDEETAEAEASRMAEKAAAAFVDDMVNFKGGACAFINSLDPAVSVNMIADYPSLTLKGVAFDD